MVKALTKPPPKTCIIVGIPGVGKTTVLNLLLELAKSEGYKMKIVNFGDKVLEEAMRKGIIVHRDEIRKLPLTVQMDLQKTAAKIIAKEAMESTDVDAFLVDTHALVHTATGFWPGLPSYVITEIKPLAIFVIEADPKDILARRIRDSGVRRRGEEREISEIKEFMYMARYTALSSAVLVGATVSIVENVEGKAEDAAKAILEIIKKL